MSIYLVDYENVNAEGLAGVEQLTAEDKVCIFYSENANTLTFSLHERINKSKADIEYIKVKIASKNSLDFQLVSYLGYLIAGNTKGEFIIVSKDMGFSSTVSFWADRKIKIELVLNLSRQSVKSMENSIKNLLPQYTEDIPLVVDSIKKYKTKQGINNALMKQFGAEKTGIIYKAIKPLLNDKKGGVS